MRHRIFIAINLPQKIKNELVQYQKEVEKFFEENIRPIRWTKKENLHITVEFLGYLHDREIEKVKEILREISKKISPFEVELFKICYVPEKEKIPRMIWAVGEKSDILCKMKRDLDQKLEKEIGFRPEKREFNPHITVGRIRKWQFKAIPLDERPEIERDIELKFKVNSIELMESFLKRTGPEYKIIESFLFS
ncbi:RNA 2',3'-cyclic phosphodiesterase [bacterium]|nr:RNA 2',3'-cyclic phosphodiesterase [bacterium]